MIGKATGPDLRAGTGDDLIIAVAVGRARRHPDAIIDDADAGDTDSLCRWHSTLKPLPTNLARAAAAEIAIRLPCFTYRGFTYRANYGISLQKASPIDIKL